MVFSPNNAYEAKRLLDEFQPELIFSQDRITFMDGELITWLPVTTITRIDLISEHIPHLLFPVGIVNAVELTGTDYQALIQNARMREWWNQMRTKDDSLVIFLDVETADGRGLFLIMETEAEVQSESRKIHGFPLEGSGLCYRMRNGGVSVLNLANLTRLTFFPGSYHAPEEAWHARLIHPGKPPMAINSIHHGTPIQVGADFTSAPEQAFPFCEGSHKKNQTESGLQMLGNTIKML